MGALPLVGGPGERGAGRVALGHPTGGVAGSVCAEGACPREALAGRGGRTLQVGPRRARACACARAGASAGRGCGAGPACQAEWRVTHGRSGWGAGSVARWVWGLERVGPREESGPRGAGPSERGRSGLALREKRKGERAGLAPGLGLVLG